MADQRQVCDDCLNCAYDNAPVSNHELQIRTATQLGDILEDHLCEEIETNGETRCDCACKRAKKKLIRDRKLREENRDDDEKGEFW